MREQYSPAVEWALRCARRLAFRDNAEAAQPLQLLHGLLQQEDGRCFSLLVRFGADRDKLRTFLPRVSETASGDMPQIPLDERIQSALRQARTLCRELSVAEPTGSEHVLVVLLREDETIQLALEEMGLDSAALEDEVITAAQGPPLPLDEPIFLDDDIETFDAGRILDAAANRAREALRVLEDYSRFVLDDAFLCRELKTLRHELAEIMAAFPRNALLQSRETQRDVGTTISTPHEQQRSSMLAVVEANAKRLQEALRSLEEFGKLDNASASAKLEQMRYRAYTLERMLVHGKATSERLAGVCLYVLLTASQCWASLETTVREAAAGGAQIFQLREKNLNDRQLLERARQVRIWTRETETLFIINDRTDIARLAEADGVHLGQDEMPVKEARRLLGAKSIIGVSTHNLEQVHQAKRDGADYIGVGPTFPSPTKTFDEFPGLDFVRQATAETSLPAFAIGGINLANLQQVLAAGGKRIAVSHAVSGSETPQALARALRQLLDAQN